MTGLHQDLQGALGDAYRIQRELGGGGMSRVYLAEETALDRQVVVKVLPPDLAAGLNAERFRREIQLAARLQHPHIVPVLAAGRAGALLFYTMPFIEGESLRAKLSREGELPVADAVRLLRDVVDALAYAHEQGVVHRDIKPDNVMVSRNHALVTDFGVAKAVSEAAGAAPGAPSDAVTTAGVAMGTPTYMAPEQAAADPTIDHRADIYAVGVMAYEMLAGNPPFAGRTPQQLLAAHVNRPPEPLGRVRATVPPDLAAVVMRCLEKRPADRWQRAEDLLRALEAVATPGTGTVATSAARSSGPEAAAAAPARRRRRGIVVSAAIVGAVAAFFGLKATGRLPGASLVDRGMLADRERVIVSEFGSPAADSALGGAVTEAFRIDLSQSPAVTVVQPDYVRQTLQRMQRDPHARLDAALAREVAIRDGIKAVVTGDVAHAGTGYVISARLISSATGDAMVALRETAEDSTRILGAIDRLSHALRRRIGESLRSIQGNEPLDQVTTPSLEALRRYSQAQMANDEGDTERAITLLREAVALDTGFAMGYRRLGVMLSNAGGRRSAAVDAFKRAYEHRNRLTDRERYLTQAAYHAFVEGDRESSIADYRSLLDIYPSDVVALNNLSILYSELRNFEEAAELARRATLVQPANITFWSNYLNALVGQGKVDSAEAALRAVEGSVRSQPFASELELSVAALKGDYDSVEAGVRRIRDSRRESLDWQTTTSSQLAALAALRGKLDQSEQHLRTAAEASAAQNLPERALFYEAAGAGLETWYRGQPARALRRLDDALRRRPLAGLDVRDRPYLPLAVVYAEAGRPDRARALVAEFDRLAPEGDRRLAESERHAALGAIALAERRPREAVEEFRLQDEGDCTVCAVASLGRAYEAAGNADSAIAAYERYVATPMLGRLVLDAIWLPRTYLRLGELYEERGNRSRAAEYYARLVRLWKDPDPELRMKVGEAKRRLEALTGERAAS